MTKSAEFRPGYAYVPGKNARHQEGLFDPIRNTISEGMSEADLAASPALLAGLTYLDEGYFWEAHEVLEPVWMACPPNSAARHAAQALIQIANAALKFRMGRPKAALRIVDIGKAHLARARSTKSDMVLGLSLDSIERRISDISSGSK